MQKQTNRGSSTCLNLGYRGAKLERSPYERAVYVTHSLGTMWALRHHARHMDALIVINGFHSFKDFTDPRILRAMKTRLQKNPDEQMKDFFERADIEADYKNLDTKNLKQGLEYLS